MTNGRKEEYGGQKMKVEEKTARKKEDKCKEKRGLRKRRAKKMKEKYITDMFHGQHDGRKDIEGNNNCGSNKSIY